MTTAPRLLVTNTSVQLQGDFLIQTIETVDWTNIQIAPAKTIDLSGIGRLDTAGAWLIVLLGQRIGSDTVISGATETQTELLETIRKHMPQEQLANVKKSTIVDQLETFGRYTVAAFQTAITIIGFMGEVIVSLLNLVIHPRQIRWTSLVHHMQQVGLNAVPIVSLMAFLIGVVLAFQGAAQLQQFGAEVFVVDLIAISILRELGILLTAIIVAGRSGSAFTAAIGSMKMREEIDAMRTLGLDPIAVLVVPRVMALTLMLPVLGVIANLAGLLGGALMSWVELGVSPAVFQSRLVSNTDVWHFSVGMIKAPFFALIIGIIGCFEGMQVRGNAESLGHLTSTSVVLSIFLVITADALFSIFFAIVGV